VPAAPCLGGGIDFLRAFFSRLVPCAVGVGDGAALDLDYSDARVRHENDKVDFDVAVRVVVQAQAGDDDLVIAEVAHDGFSYGSFRRRFIPTHGNVTRHDLTPPIAHAATKPWQPPDQTRQQ
jgi:hypothetical protein